MSNEKTSSEAYMSKLQREFYESDTLIVAKELLGKLLVHDTIEGTTTGRIVEVEAYIGPGDAAAHTYQGLRSARTEVFFGPGGYAYVYMIYGMYYCFNIVSNTVDKPEAILIRALEPVDGIELMKRRRKTDKITNLCSGPGKLCSAMGITKESYAVDLCGDHLYLLEREKLPESDIISTPRINIDYAGEAKDYPWRFLIKGNKFVSR
jgi:DNA-3-methyladenine glycosylase